MKKVLFFLLFQLLASNICAQVLGASPAIRVGMNQEEVQATFGAPQLYFSSATSRFFTPSEYALLVRSASYPFAHIYSRKTASNEYQLRVFYSMDTRQSRLHPTARVVAVDFVFDHPLPLGDALTDLVEAQELCAERCRVVALSKLDERKILVYPVAITAEQRDLAGLAAEGYQRAPDEQFSWSPAIFLTPVRPTTATVDWSSVEQLRIGVSAPSFETRQMSIPGFYSKVIADWKYTGK